MHFKNQCTLIAREKGSVLQIKAFAVRRGAFPSRGKPEKPSVRHRQPTVDRDEPRNFRAWDLAGAVAPHVQLLFQ